VFGEHFLAVNLKSIWFTVTNYEQCLENTDYILIATLYSHIGDSYVGLAGLENASTSHSARLRATSMARAELYIDRARECKLFFSFLYIPIMFPNLSSIFLNIDRNKCSRI